MHSVIYSGLGSFCDHKMHEIWSVDSQEFIKNCCHQMSDFKAKMHQIRFRLGFRPRLRWWSLQRSRDPLAGFKGPTSKGREERGEEREGKGEVVRKKERGERGKRSPCFDHCIPHAHHFILITISAPPVFRSGADDNSEHLGVDKVGFS